MQEKATFDSQEQQSTSEKQKETLSLGNSEIKSKWKAEVSNFMNRLIELKAKEEDETFYDTDEAILYSLMNEDSSDFPTSKSQVETFIERLSELEQEMENSLQNIKFEVAEGSETLIVHSANKKPESEQVLPEKHFFPTKSQTLDFSKRVLSNIFNEKRGNNESGKKQIREDTAMDEFDDNNSHPQDSESHDSGTTQDGNTNDTDKVSAGFFDNANENNFSQASFQNRNKESGEQNEEQRTQESNTEYGNSANDSASKKSIILSSVVENGLQEASDGLDSILGILGDHLQGDIFHEDEDFDGIPENNEMEHEINNDFLTLVSIQPFTSLDSSSPQGMSSNLIMPEDSSEDLHEHQNPSYNENVDPLFLSARSLENNDDMQNINSNPSWSAHSLTPYSTTKESIYPFLLRGLGENSVDEFLNDEEDKASKLPNQDEENSILDSSYSDELPDLFNPMFHPSDFVALDVPVLDIPDFDSFHEGNVIPDDFSSESVFESLLNDHSNADKAFDDSPNALRQNVNNLDSTAFKKTRKSALSNPLNILNYLDLPNGENSRSNVYDFHLSRENEENYQQQTDGIPNDGFLPSYDSLLDHFLKNNFGRNNQELVANQDGIELKEEETPQKKAENEKNFIFSDAANTPTLEELNQLSSITEQNFPSGERTLVSSNSSPANRSSGMANHTNSGPVFPNFTPENMETIGQTEDYFGDNFADDNDFELDTENSKSPPEVSEQNGDPFSPNFMPPNPFGNDLLFSSDSFASHNDINFEPIPFQNPLRTNRNRFLQRNDSPVGRRNLLNRFGFSPFLNNEPSPSNYYQSWSPVSFPRQNFPPSRPPLFANLPPKFIDTPPRTSPRFRPWRGFQKSDSLPNEERNESSTLTNSNIRTYEESQFPLPSFRTTISEEPSKNNDDYFFHPANTQTARPSWMFWKWSILLNSIHSPEIPENDRSNQLQHYFPSLFQDEQLFDRDEFGDSEFLPNKENVSDNNDDKDDDDDDDFDDDDSESNLENVDVSAFKPIDNDEVFKNTNQTSISKGNFETANVVFEALKQNKENAFVELEEANKIYSYVNNCLIAGAIGFSIIFLLVGFLLVLNIRKRKSRKVMVPMSKPIPFKASDENESQNYFNKHPLPEKGSFNAYFIDV